MAKVKKLTDKQFLAVLRENGGILAKTAKAIREQYNVPFSRQAVRDRAAKFPEELADIEEECIDTAEAGLQSLMKSDDQRIKLKACELFLKTKGRGRGYVEKTETVVEQQIFKTEVQVKTSGPSFASSESEVVL